MSLRRIASSLPRPYSAAASEFTAGFWAGLEAGEFRVARCRDCERLQFPPRPACPACLGDAIEWQAIDGSGVLYSRTRIHAAGGPFACMTPYTVGLVDLDAGVRVLTRLMPSASSLPIGAAVELAIIEHSDGPLFVAVAA